ncbi:hypothetical protein [Streptomyces roseifaciens]|uniref:hypothetical protein n=1 Tax=Streptomyces roseifaciens TaxID=1488406 RepID=UPI0007182B09|nr:hypothetical protein [Streptomyces roseifaciens]
MPDLHVRGILGAAWDTRSLGRVQVDDLPSPDVLMVRAGFLVGIDLLDATTVLRTAWKVDETWGMSPFGGGHRKVWEEFDPRPFLRPPHRDLSRTQAAFRTAFHCPAPPRWRSAPTTPDT